MSIYKLVALSLITSFWAGSAYCAPEISGISHLNSVGQYEKFEVQFGVNTNATEPFWYFDESPNPGIPPREGITVDGLFLPPGVEDWGADDINAIKQPAFYCQGFSETDNNGNTHTTSTGHTWVYPDDSPKWRLRFATDKTGGWRFKIKVRDKDGESVSEERVFNCLSGDKHGFVRVAPNDSRYFELSDGKYVPYIGICYDTYSVPVMQRDYTLMENLGVTMVRAWWQRQGPGPVLRGDSYQTFNGLVYSSEQVYPGQLVSAKLTKNQQLRTSVSCYPNRKYVFKVKAKLAGVSGPPNSGLRLGIFNTSVGDKYSEYMTTGNEWRDLSVAFTTAFNQWEISFVKATLENVTEGTAYISHVSLKEDLGNGQYGPELLMRPHFDAHRWIPQQMAYVVDRQLDIAAEHGIYIKAVIEEKVDPFFARIQPDGTFGATDANNVYANETHAQRTMQKYYWRYLIARYGYSTALHSIEFLNEADPFNGNHKNAVAAIGDYFDENDPNRHLVSTSNWLSFPPDMWLQPSVDYADLHFYIGETSTSGGNRLWAGWDGTWTNLNRFSTPGDGFTFDTTTAKTGSNSFKISIPATPNDIGTQSNSNACFQVGVVPGHQYRISYWAKGENVKFKEKHHGHGILATLQAYGNDFVNFFTGGPGYLGGYVNAPQGTYDWTFVTHTNTVSRADARILLINISRNGNNDAAAGTLWIDDVVVEDLTTGETLNYNGGFENLEPESYDWVAGHLAYSKLARSFAFGKPTIRGETGSSFGLRFTNPYQGYYHDGEEQLLYNDTEGVWWRKFVWAHTDPDGMIDIFWWGNRIVLDSRFGQKYPLYGKAFQQFMSDIPLSNGNYRDAQAETSNPLLRATGQKDLSTNRAFLWIDNIKHTWKNVVDKKPIPEQTGSVTIDGLTNGNYYVDWYDPAGGVKVKSETVECRNGRLTVNIDSLGTDIACKVNPAISDVSLRLLVPAGEVEPGQTIIIRVEYRNNGGVNSSNVLVSAGVPSEMRYVEGSAEASGGRYDQATGTVSWVVDSVAPGEVGTRQFSAVID